jgi:hypothetical protein
MDARTATELGQRIDSRRVMLEDVERNRARRFLSLRESLEAVLRRPASQTTREPSVGSESVQTENPPSTTNPPATISTGPAEHPVAVPPTQDPATADVPTTPPTNVAPPAPPKENPDLAQSRLKVKTEVKKTIQQLTTDVQDIWDLAYSLEDTAAEHNEEIRKSIAHVEKMADIERKARHRDRAKYADFRKEDQAEMQKLRAETATQLENQRKMFEGMMKQLSTGFQVQIDTLRATIQALEGPVSQIDGLKASVQNLQIPVGHITTILRGHRTTDGSRSDSFTSRSNSAAGEPVNQARTPLRDRIESRE